MSREEPSALSRWLDRRLRAMLARTARRSSADEEDPGSPGVVIALCVLASTLLWFSFSMRQSYTRLLDIPTRVENLAPDEALTGLPPSTVRVQVEAQGIQLLRLYYNPPTLPVDASQLPVDLAMVAPEIISNVRLESVTPRNIMLQKEQRLTRKVPIFVEASVATEPGHHVVGGLRVEPDSVTISGARSLVASITAWPTQRVRIPVTGDTLRTQIALSDSLAGLVSRNVSSVTVSASVPEFTEGTRRIPVRVEGLPPGQRVTLDPATVSVIYQVPLGQFNRALQGSPFYATVSWEVIRRDTTGSVLPVVQVPPGLVFREVRTEPAALRYYFYVLDE
jgi:hypothetical protein